MTDRVCQPDRQPWGYGYPITTVSMFDMPCESGRSTHDEGVIGFTKGCLATRGR